VDQGMSRAPGNGPGNKVIVTTLLASLAVRGQLAAHTRAMRALGLADSELASAPVWISDEALVDMFVAGEVEPSLTRSVGHRLVSPDVTGIVLYGLGLATPEKAYRRVQALLPRHRKGAAWTVEKIDSGSARLCFHDRRVRGEADSESRRRPGSERGTAALCTLHAGMLEAIPCLYGLLPARVVETTCRARGADACRYEVVWRSSKRSGLVAGSALGLALAVVGVGLLAWISPAILSIAGAAVVAASSAVLGGAIGRCVDLSRQLEAVAGARRGHLALFDQVDDALASKLDALARADAKLEGDDFAYRADRSRASAGGEPSQAVRDASRLLEAAEKIHGLAGDLECSFKEVGNFDGASRGQLREIRDSAEELVEGLSPEGARLRKAVDLVTLLERAIATTRPSLPPTTRIEFEHEAGLHSIECEPVQIEQVVVQLLRNAASASHPLSESPLIEVSLARVPGGIEFAIEDRGVGIDPVEIDEVFDPFFGDPVAGVDGSFGLPICLRIVERHGGELRIEVEDRSGTRVSVFLPESPSSGS
jgi:signal transduction histidine kinase